MEAKLLVALSSLCLWLSVLASNAHKLAEREFRIANGVDANVGEFPHSILLLIGSSHCTGSILDRRHVITAAHCLKNAEDRFVSPRRVLLVAGELWLDSSLDGELLYNASRYHLASGYLGDDAIDIAIVELAGEGILFRHTEGQRGAIQPVALPGEPSELKPGERLLLAGWGKVASREMARTLQRLEVSVAKCRLPMARTSFWFCLEPSSNILCSGDSGAGSLRRLANGSYQLVGIHHATFRHASGNCLPGGQAVEHKLWPFLPWIRRILASGPEAAPGAQKGTGE